MTLLEAIIAFVILSVVGVVCLDQARGAARLQATSAEWTRAVARGESALAEAAADVAHPPATSAASTGGLAATDIQVSRQAWRSGIDRVEVAVPLSGGARFVLTRLVAVPSVGVGAR